MATHGNIGQFDRGTEDWKAYCERLEQYFLANDVDDAAKQRAILLSVCGAAAYQLIRNLVAPAKPTDKSFADIVKLVQDHYTPPPSVTVQRFKFHSRSQKEGESIAEFVAELRRLSEHCQFEATLDDMLRDRLVCGVRDVRIQRRLLAEADLSFKKSFELSQAAEVAEQSAKDLQKPQQCTLYRASHLHATAITVEARTPPTPADSGTLSATFATKRGTWLKSAAARRNSNQHPINAHDAEVVRTGSLLNGHCR